jgi:hypothetical protein
MVYPGTIPSPGANTTTYTQDDYSSQDLGSLIESFQSPGGDRNIFAGVAGKRDHKFTAATPQRQVFGPLTNRAGAGGARNEFTPLLKSVHRSQMKSKVNGGIPVPEFLKPGARIGSSPMLPTGTPGGDARGDSTYRTEGEEDETISPAQGLPDSSVGSTPMGPRGGGGGAGGNVAPLGGDGLMTLREQEKVIDEIKKENFGLKLKVFFLNERLEKLGPEHNDAALKEVSVGPVVYWI